MKFVHHIDLLKNELQNARIQNLAAAPAAPVKGQLYFNTVENRAFVYNGADWLGMDSIGATMTGENIVSAINLSSSTINDARLSAGVNTAVTNSHTHSNKATLDAITAAYTTALNTKLTGIESGAQVNAVTTVAGRTGAVTLSSGDVGLSSVTNHAQVKKLASSTNGFVPVWSVTTGDALGAGYSVETTLTGASTALARADAIKNYIDAFLSANDAMVFKGTLGTGGTLTALPTTHSAGWTYRIITAATYAGKVCEVGDMIVSVMDRSGSGNINDDWTVIQTNIDGAVTGPASATAGNFPIFSGTSGKIIANSTFNSSSFAPAVHTHSQYTQKYSTTLAAQASQTITHNLGTRDATVSIRTTASPYELVITDVEFSTDNTVLVRFAAAPSAGEYTITIVG
jgi:hypothetical protein